MLFQPGGTFPARHFQLDVELLESLLQLLLVPSVVCSYSIVEEDELVMQHLHLMEGQTAKDGLQHTDPNTENLGRFVGPLGWKLILLRLHNLTLTMCRKETLNSRTFILTIGKTCFEEIYLAAQLSYY